MASVRIDSNAVLILGGIAAVLILFPRLLGKAVQGTVEAAAQIPAGAVKGTGAALGVPVTQQDKCMMAIAMQETWDASFFCPAPVFARYLFSDSDSALQYAQDYSHYG